MSNELSVVDQTVGFDKIYQLAERLSKSNIIPTSLRGKPGDLAVILLTGQELNLPPMTSLNLITVVQGRPELSAQGKIAVIKRAYPDSVIKIESSDSKAVCSMAMSKNHDPITVEFTLSDAKRAGLLDRDTWKKFPSTMLRWRAISQCARLVFPHILAGLYDIDEVQDIPVKENYKEDYINRDMIPKEKEEKKYWDPKPLPDSEPKSNSNAHLNATYSFGQFKGRTIPEVPVKETISYIKFLQSKDFKFLDVRNHGFFEKVAEYIGDASFLVNKADAQKVIECKFCHETYVASLSECANCGRNESEQEGPTFTDSDDSIPF